MDHKRERINSISIDAKDTIKFALKRMDETYKRLLLIFDNTRFINVLSIGDIQRAIINNVSLDSSVEIILRSETKIAHTTDSFDTIKNQMLEYRAECMPVIDENSNLVDVHFWEDVFHSTENRNKTKIDLPVIIMAGGRGTRMKPLTNILPKPLIPLGEKSIIENIMDKFQLLGSNTFYISLNYKAELIKHYFTSSHNNKYNLHFFEEEKPLGTVGSLFMLNGKISQSFFITNCDILINEDYSEIYKYHVESENEITIVAALKHYSIPYGTIKSGENGKLISLNEKPELTYKINTGMYILEPQLLQEIPENQFYHITHLIDKIKSRKGRIGVFPVSENSWLDIGQWDEYILLTKNLKSLPFGFKA